MFSALLLGRQGKHQNHFIIQTRAETKKSGSALKNYQPIYIDFLRLHGT